MLHVVFILCLALRRNVSLIKVKVYVLLFVFIH